jgi:hypothetical protein
VQDDILDELKNQIFRELLTYMLGDPHTIEPGIGLILISRHLEGIGDHATNIAEDVIFIVLANDVRHHAANGNPLTADRGPRDVPRALPMLGQNRAGRGLQIGSKATRRGSEAPIAPAEKHQRMARFDPVMERKHPSDDNPVIAAFDNGMHRAPQSRRAPFQPGSAVPWDKLKRRP